MAAETAQSQLGLTTQLGDYVQGNVEPSIITDIDDDGIDDTRRPTDFQSNRITNPSGGAGSVVNTNTLWDSSR